MKEEDRKCVIYSKRYCGTYLSGSASYVSKLINAEIFTQSEIPDYQKNDSNNEVIFLDSQRGLELLAREIESLDRKIPQEEANLERLKKGREKLFNSNPEMLSKYIERHNFLQNPLIGTSPETKERIINEIAN